MIKAIQKWWEKYEDPVYVPVYGSVLVIFWVIVVISFVNMANQEVEDMQINHKKAEKIISAQSAKSSHSSKNYICYFNKIDIVDNMYPKEHASALITWIKNNPDKTIVALTCHPEQGGASCLYVVYKNISPDFVQFVKLYDAGDSDNSVIAIDKITKEQSNIITICAISGWRGGVGGFIVVCRR